MDESLCALPAERIRAAALVAGSFDPVTLGHLELVERAGERFARVYVTLFVNPDKHCLFSLSQRLAFLRAACAPLPYVQVEADEGMLADYALKKGIRYVVKGVRSAEDRDYEREQAAFNHRRNPSLQTILLPSSEAMRSVSSTRVRERLKNGESLQGLVPPVITEMLEREYRKLL